MGAGSFGLLEGSRVFVWWEGGPRVGWGAVGWGGWRGYIISQGIGKGIESWSYPWCFSTLWLANCYAVGIATCGLLNIYFSTCSPLSPICLFTVFSAYSLKRKTLWHVHVCTCKIFIGFATDKLCWVEQQSVMLTPGTWQQHLGSRGSVCIYVTRKY